MSGVSPITENLDFLDQLRDVIQPIEPGIWPPAIGWWIVGLLSILLVWGVIYGARRLRIHHSKNSIANQVLAIGSLHPKEAVVELSVLMRKIAVTKYPRDKVAGLTGEAWLKFLDKTGNTNQFTAGPGSLLATAPYAGVSPNDVEPLISVCHDWVNRVLSGDWKC